MLDAKSFCIPMIDFSLKTKASFSVTKMYDTK